MKIFIGLTIINLFNMTALFALWLFFLLTALGATQAQSREEY